MQSYRKILIPTVAIFVLTLGATLVYAQHPGKGGPQTAQEALQAMTQHKMTLVSAIESAEKDTSGQAVNASAQMHSGAAVVFVTCVVGEQTKHVQVDVATGKVTEMPMKPRTGMSGANHEKHEQPKKKP